MNSDSKEVRDLLALSATKIDACKDALGSQDIAMAFYGMQVR